MVAIQISLKCQPSPRPNPPKERGFGRGDGSVTLQTTIQIDRVDKTSPVHPKLLLGKIMEIRKGYAKIVTPKGIS